MDDRTLRNANPQSHSEESNHPNVNKLPREPGGKREWGKPGLMSASSMFKPRNKSTPSLAEYEKEAPVEGVEGSRHHDLGIKTKVSTGFKGRDVRNAEQNELGVKAAAAQRYIKLKGRS